MRDESLTSEMRDWETLSCCGLGLVRTEVRIIARFSLRTDQS